MKPVTRVLLLLAIAVFVPMILIVSCAKRSPTIELPQGVQQYTGVIKPAELSLVRRGTHVFEVDGRALVFLESPSTPLSQYENMEVTVRGTLERNSEEKMLPVMVVESVTPKAVVLRQWKIQPLGMTLSAPEEWAGTQSGSNLRFTLSGSVRPFLTIGKSPVKELPGGTPVTVGGEPAVRTMDSGSGSQMLYVQRGTDIITISFVPAGTGTQQSEMIRNFSRVLQSVTFSGQRPAGSTGSSTGTGAAGIPCGGPAGILCPAGQYCEVADRTTDIGRCRKL